LAGPCGQASAGRAGTGWPAGYSAKVQKRVRSAGTVLYSERTGQEGEKKKKKEKEMMMMMEEEGLRKGSRCGVCGEA
jgi:hypothetical protein